MRDNTNLPQRRVLALSTATLIVAGCLSAMPTTAHAAPKAHFGAITASFSDQVGDPHGTADSNCLRYSPIGTANSSGWVKAGQEAKAAHGRVRSTDECPSALSEEQSYLSFTPSTATSVALGARVALGTIRHHNKQVRAQDNLYKGNLNIKLSNVTMDREGKKTASLSFPWMFNETKNEPGPVNDVITFTKEISQVVYSGGERYRITIAGFLNNGTNPQCPTSLPQGASLTRTFTTAEDTDTYGCIFGTVDQLREVTIVTKIADESPTPSMFPDFAFKTTSNLKGSPWDGSNFTLRPTRIGESVKSDIRLASVETETLSVTQTTPQKWHLDNISCVDGIGRLLGAAEGVHVDAASGKVTVTAKEESSAEKSPITCTFTNRYVPKAQLTLEKIVDNRGSASAQPSAWTLRADGPTPLQGEGRVTATVDTGTYTLSESGGPSGYVQEPWVCTNAAGAAIPLGTGSSIIVNDDDNITCTVKNRFAAGRFTVTKAITGLNDGLTDPATEFGFTWKCVKDATTESGTGKVSVAKPFVKESIPAGTRCNIVEDETKQTQLKDLSYMWEKPVYEPGDSVEIQTDATATIAITNTIAKRDGEVKVDKKLGSVLQQEDGTWKLSYTVTATNSYDIDAPYSLEDRLAFGKDIQVVTVKAIGANGAEAEPTWNGKDKIALVTDKTLKAKSSTSWTVEVVAKVGAQTSVTDRNCTMEAGEKGTGFLNQAVLTSGSQISKAEACGQPAVPMIAKTYAGTSVHISDDKPDGTWDVNYDVTVTNPHATPLVYHLSEQPKLGSSVKQLGVLVDSASMPEAIYFSDVQPIKLPAKKLAPGESHVYRVVLHVDTKGTQVSTSQCADPVWGVSNRAEVISGEFILSAEACGAVPPKAQVTIAKKLQGRPVRTKGNMWKIAYAITVTNPSEHDTTFALDDQLSFGEGFLVKSAKVKGVGTLSSWNGSSSQHMVASQVIKGKKTLTYMVMVTAEVSPDATPGARDCALVSGESGTGFLNQATVLANGKSANAQACGAPTDGLPATGPTGNKLHAGLLGLAGLIAVGGSAYFVRSRRVVTS